MINVNPEIAGRMLRIKSIAQLSEFNCLPKQYFHMFLSWSNLEVDVDSEK